MGVANGRVPKLLSVRVFVEFRCEAGESFNRLEASGAHKRGWGWVAAARWCAIHVERNR